MDDIGIFVFVAEFVAVIVLVSLFLCLALFGLIWKSFRKNVYSFDFEFVGDNKRGGQRCNEQLQ